MLILWCSRLGSLGSWMLDTGNEDDADPQANLMSKLVL